MTESSTLVERELNLLSLALLAVRRWRILLGVGIAAAILAAFVLSVTPSTYEAASKILVKRTSSSEASVGLDRTVVEPDYFAATLESDAVLQMVLEKCGLHQEPYKFDIERFRGAVDVSPIRNENSIQIRVRLPDLEDTTPQKAAEVANAFVTEAGRLATELLEEDIQRSMLLFDQQLERAKKELEEVRTRHQEVFLTAPLEEKQKEIENLHLYQRQLQTSLALAKADLEQKAPKLPILEKYLEKEQRTLKVHRALDEEGGFLGVVAAATGKSATESYSATSESEVVNDVYTNLRNLRDTTQADVEGLSTAVDSLERDSQALNQKIQSAERILNASKEAVEYWNDRLETAILTHRAVDERHKVAGLAIAADRQDMVSQYPAVPPTKPSGVPRVILVAITPILAMIIFLAILLLVEIVRVSLQPDPRMRG